MVGDVLLLEFFGREFGVFKVLFLSVGVIYRGLGKDGGEVYGLYVLSVYGFWGSFGYI